MSKTALVGLILALVAIAALFALIFLWWGGGGSSPVDRRILTGDPCAAPCWQGIVPGEKMAPKEALRLVRGLPHVIEAWLAMESDHATVTWVWPRWPEQEHLLLNSIDLVAETVIAIDIQPEFKLFVEDVITEYGAPEETHSITVPSTDESAASL